MHRRNLLRTSAMLASALCVTPAAHAGLARQTPGATPRAPEEQPIDTRARELVDQLSRLSPLPVLEALETSEVTESALVAAGNGAPVSALPWNDPSDTDLEHALGGVLIVASDDPVNSPDLVTLGTYIVFESPEIAFQVLTRQFEDEGELLGSTSFAGTKAWIVTSDDMMLAVMRLGYVLVIAADPMAQHSAGEGLIEHLAATIAPIDPAS